MTRWGSSSSSSNGSFVRRSTTSSPASPTSRVTPRMPNKGSIVGGRSRRLQGSQARGRPSSTRPPSAARQVRSRSSSRPKHARLPLVGPVHGGRLHVEGGRRIHSRSPAMARRSFGTTPGRSPMASTAWPPRSCAGSLLKERTTTIEALKASFETGDSPARRQLRASVPSTHGGRGRATGTADEGQEALMGHHSDSRCWPTPAQLRRRSPRVSRRFPGSTGGRSRMPCPRPAPSSTTGPARGRTRSSTGSPQPPRAGTPTG